MSEQIKTKKSTLEWCREQNALGKELKLCWEGGGDSGYAHFELDGEELKNEYTEELIDRIYEELDYGSWAGEFHATGEAIFNPEENAFVGTDYYGEDNSVNMDCDIKLNVPKELWFDRVEIDIEKSGEDETEITFKFIISNGFLTPEHEKFTEDVEISLKNDVEEFIESKDFHNFRGIWHDVHLEYSQFVENGDVITAPIEQISVTLEDETAKGIYLQLIEEENEQQN